MDKNQESICQKKLDDIYREVEKTDITDREKLVVLASNAKILNDLKKKEPKGFKKWISKVDATDVIKLAFSVGMFVIVLHGESIGKVLMSRATGFIPWGKTPK